MNERDALRRAGLAVATAIAGILVELDRLNETLERINASLRCSGQKLAGDPTPIELEIPAEVAAMFP